jgi:glycosyltransferase involved in cell wall biosynthesis
VKAIIQSKSDVVLFAFRNALLDALSINSSFRHLQNLHNAAAIGILVPDYLEIEDSGFQISQLLIGTVDFLLATNLDLEAKYTKLYGSDCHVAIYHDLVDVNSIKVHRNIEGILSRQIIWVGNSLWGKRQGKIDHKGLQEIVTPIRKLPSLKEFSFKIIDSSVSKRSHQEVLSEIGKASILLHPSKSEGTGLPILEASLLGCFPITTNVGIADELLGKDFGFLIVERDVQKSEQAILISLEKDNRQREKLIQTAEEFLNQISQETIPTDLVSKGNTIQIHLSKIRQVSVLMKWNYRFYMNRLK